MLEMTNKMKFYKIQDMKKLITTLFAILLTINALALDVWDGTASPWTTGDGTVSNPYLIETAENLAYLAEKVNEGYQAQGMEVFKYTYFLMTDDFDLNNINWTPIGNVDYVNSNIEGYYFAGIFDGWYHTISNMKIQTNSNLTGLFAGLGGEQGPPPSDRTGQIRHLSVVNGSVTSSGFGAGGIVGAIAGEALVYQCSFSGTISISNGDQFCGAGGIVAAAAQNSGISECSFSGNISATNSAFTGAAGAGGIVGIAMDNVAITNCYNTGTINGNALIISVAAGIAGATLQENNVSIYSCYNVGTVSAGTKGGIFGMVSPINPTKEESSIEVSNCFYLNTCGGTTNYGTSKTSAEMQTEQFKNQLDQSTHKFVMDNGTNNGYPIHALSGFMIYEAKDVTAHSATLSANLHPGNATFSRAYFFYDNEAGTDYHEVDIATEGYVEAIIENLEANTDYMFSMTLDYSDGGFVGFTPHWLTTLDNTGIIETNNHTIQIYPNPTSDFITIENIEPQLVRIYSLDGRLVKQVESAKIIDVRDLKEGLYLINIGNLVKTFIFE